MGELASREDESSDTRRFTFKLPNSSDVLGLPCGMHFLTRIKGATGKATIRAYTPISNDKRKGAVELLIKVYYPNENFPEGGKMSQLFDALKVGDTVDFKGPMGMLEYHGRSKFTVHGEKTKMALAFGNRTDDDILCRRQLETFAKNKNISVTHVVTQPSKGWKGETGRVRREIIEKTFYPPGDDVLNGLCGPPGMVQSLTKQLLRWATTESEFSS